ncbi:MAG: hypothetical protein AB1523_03785 [Bacillota bacterium]
MDLRRAGANSSGDLPLGRDAWNTIRKIRRQYSGESIQATAIGPAGENLVRFASIENGPAGA